MKRLKALNRIGIILLTTPFLIFCQAFPASSPDAPSYILAEEGENTLYVAEDGSDQNPGTSEAPLKSLALAAGLAKPGTEVLIKKGTYREPLITRSGGLPGKEIVFRSYGGLATIDGSDLPWVVGGDQNQGLVELRHPYVRIENLLITHSKNSGVVLSSDHLSVSGCEISWVERHAINTHTSFQTNHPQARGFMLKDILIENNSVHDATQGGKGQGQAISLTADGFSVNGNRVYSNRTEGIDIWLGATHGEVFDNTVFDQGQTPGIYVDGASYLRIHGNRVFSNLHGIMLSSETENYETHHVWVYNNLVYDNRGYGLCLWDPNEGPREVLFAQNTLVGNREAFSFDGKGETAEVVNNLVYPRSERRAPSGIFLHHNTWLSDLDGFVAPFQNDYRLNFGSPAIDQGAPLPALIDDRGRSFAIDSDFDGIKRQDPDTGAFELL